MSRWWTVLLLTLLVPVAQAATPWHADAGSELRFRATQAGARFEGRFASFDASIVFDERDLAGSRFDVTITLASADTRDADRDGVLKGADFFHVERYPQARFVATKFRKVGAGYVADGELTLRGVTRPVAVAFTLARSGPGATLSGSALLRRLEFGVGQGEWRSTASVGNEVEVLFTLKLSRADAKVTRNAARGGLAARS